MDKTQTQYVLTLYECENKINLVHRQINEMQAPSKTKNYFLDDIYDPYANRLRHYNGGFTEKDLLNLMLRLEAANKIHSGWAGEVKKF